MSSIDNTSNQMSDIEIENKYKIIISSAFIEALNSLNNPNLNNKYDIQQMTDIYLSIIYNEIIAKNEIYNNDIIAKGFLDAIINALNTIDYNFNISEIHRIVDVFYNNIINNTDQDTNNKEKSIDIINKIHTLIDNQTITKEIINNNSHKLECTCSNVNNNNNTLDCSCMEKFKNIEKFNNTNTNNNIILLIILIIVLIVIIKYN